MWILKNKPDLDLLAYHKMWWVKIPTWACLVFLYLPIVILIVFSFNDSKRNIVWRGFTTHYYEEFFRNTLLQQAFINSLTIAFLSMIIAVTLGTMGAYALNRLRFPGRMGFDIAINIPLAVPEICVAIGTMVLFSQFNFPPGLPYPFNLTLLVLAHAAFTLPFVTMIIRVRLHAFNPALEEVALDMGATPKDVIMDLIIPHLKPAILAASLLAFILSLDDFVVTFFVSGPDTPTFPVAVYSMVRQSVTPEVNAASTMLILVTIVSLLIWLWLSQRGAKRKHHADKNAGNILE